MDLAAWQRYFAACQIKNVRAIAKIDRAYSGNAKAMNILGDIIQEDYDEDVEQYWPENSHHPLIETNLRNLVVTQFNRLQLNL